MRRVIINPGEQEGTSFFIINEGMGNNHFSYQVVKTQAVGEIKTVKIKTGNYSHTDLLGEINSSIESNGDAVTFSVDITSNGSGTGKTYIRNSESDLIHIYFDRDENGLIEDIPIPLKFGWILGFRHNEYVGNQNYVSEGMYEDGFKEGNWKYYYESGYLSSTCNYIKGIKEGIREKFYPDINPDHVKCFIETVKSN